MGPPPQIPPPRQHITRQKIHKKASANFVAAITDKPILKPVKNQLENSVINSETRTYQEYKNLLNYLDKDIWMTSFASELGLLAQGVGDHIPTGTEIVFFIRRSLVPKRRKVTYGKCFVEIQPTKEETHRTPLTVGVNLIYYPGDVSTPMSYLTTLKVFLNSKISTPGSLFMTSNM